MSDQNDQNKPIPPRMRPGVAQDRVVRMGEKRFILSEMVGYASKVGGGWGDVYLRGLSLHVDECYLKKGKGKQLLLEAMAIRADRPWPDE